MPLLPSLNDREFYDQLYARVHEFAQTEQARQLAEHLRNDDDAMELIRTLPQRDDLGDPNDGPRIFGKISQRLRLPTLDPNCVERLALFLAIMLHLDPDRNLSAATMMLDNGLHSFPVEFSDGFARPVVLDPMTTPPRNAMVATVYELRNASPAARGHVARWFTEVARNACIEDGADDCYDTAMAALRHSLLTGQPIDKPEDLTCVLALTERDAALFGNPGRTAYRRVYRSLRNLAVALDTDRVGTFLDGLVGAAKPMASSAIKAALITQFGPAAQIALAGTKLAVEQSQKSAGSDSTKATAQADTAETKPSKAKTKPSKAKRRKRVRGKDRQATREQLRRMTLAFRK